MIRELIRDLLDPDPCEFDHHGNCQAHGWTKTEPRCPHVRAREFLKRTDQPMGMSSHVYAFVPPDDTWQKMKAVYDACKAAGLDVPDEVSEFFDDGKPDDAGRAIDKATLRRDGILADYQGDMSEGFEIDVPALMSTYPHATKIRFENSW